jgi:hypothetical protein
VPRAASRRKTTPSPSSVPDNPAIHRLVAVSPNAYPAYVKPISGGYRSPSRKAKRNGGFLRPVRPRTKAGLLVLRRDAETYGAAESVRTPTADRCCHEGRQKPSMARWTKLARVEDWRGPERTLPSGSGWQDRQHQGRHGATSLRKLLPQPCPDLTGRRWEKSRRRLSFIAISAMLWARLQPTPDTFGRARLRCPTARSSSPGAIKLHTALPALIKAGATLEHVCDD